LVVVNYRLLQENQVGAKVQSLKQLPLPPESLYRVEALAEDYLSLLQQ
jgi:hypothetical protein